MKIKGKQVSVDIPRAFKLFSSTYKVELDNKANDLIDSMGMFSDNLKTIKLATQVGFDELPADSILDVYYHELAHALVYNTGEKDYFKNETFVELLGKLLRQYLDTVKY